MAEVVLRIAAQHVELVGVSYAVQQNDKGCLLGRTIR